MEETTKVVAKRKSTKRKATKKAPIIKAEKVDETILVMPEGITIKTYPEGATSDPFLAKQAEETVRHIAKFAEKKKRVPVGLRDPMALSQELDPNFEYRFVRNTPGRVQKFEEGGYEMVTGDARIGDPNIAKASNMGSAFSIASGDNADRVYLMRIPKQFYQEDQAAKAAKLDETEQQLKQRPKDQGLEGEIKLNR